MWETKPRYWLLLIIVPFMGCKPPPHLRGNGYVIGINNMVPLKNHGTEVPVKIQLASVLIATSLLPAEIKFCSGALIAPETPEKHPRVLTNHHCLAHTDKKTDQPLDDLLLTACSSTTVFLGLKSADLSSVVQRNCSFGSLKTSSTLDLAVFTLSGPLPPEFTPLEIDDSLPQVFPRAAQMVHYPDIGENHVDIPSLKVTLPTAEITKDDCITLGPFARSDWAVDAALPFSVQHTCDIIHGSSGAALVDAETLKILGINWGGISKSNANKQTVQVNSATAAPFVRAFLNSTPDSLEKNLALTLSSNADARSNRKEQVVGEVLSGSGGGWGGCAIRPTGVSKKP